MAELVDHPNDVENIDFEVEFEWLMIAKIEDADADTMLGQHVGSHQVPFPMCTLETLQKYCSTSSLLLTFC